MSFRPAAVGWLPVLVCLSALLAHPSSAAESGQIITMGPKAQGNAALTVSTVQSGALGKTLEAMGTVTSEASRIVRLHPAGSGKVLHIAVVPGQHVRKGDVLLTYQDHALHLVRLEMARAQSALATAQAAYQNAAAAHDRGRLLAGSTVSEGENKRRLAAFQAAKSDIIARQADVDTLTHQLREEYNSVTESDRVQTSRSDETSAIIAPAAAEVQNISVGVADDVSPATELMTLSDISSVWIISDILPQDAAQVAEGSEQTTELVSDTGTTLLKSQITSVGDVADPATGLVRVISTVPNPDGRLRPGMFLNTHLPAQGKTTGIVVPESAVMDINGISIVFIPVGPDRFRPQEVRVSGTSNGQKVITSGLSAGERIVTHGAFALKEVMLVSDSDDGD
ncbi:efflux RND transporter periplasmic adaptor subunit [Acetobacter sp.]|uniref:efflux RND transporter periplasmic adaptor subunit n=1 Tax=Acetobacter sp. TaxID=440 RepID=UPI0025C36384|nr:efflux RND transporter periplasmic adaptor subunit [Acetobacter sp.]MCH4091407.1 efflux RND transporter periplasmic adaptor subunit [Acetobacter sp.]MCI1299385.1 efflux RND transporter periplasmic adaptor subunit [Acetobacter sp.]MCI1316611.1 efflux RND transporter periplasmic adaptor subunit [Acetobacter sp.]